MRNIRTWADIEKARKTGNLTPAEEQLITCCQAGVRCKLGDGTRPTTPSAARTIGADLLRYLITGGCDNYPLHDIGIWLGGAYVTGSLNLDYARAKGATALANCCFQNEISATNSTFKNLSLNGSYLTHGLNAQAANIAGSVNLTKTLMETGTVKFLAAGTVNFAGAKIGRQLVCEEGCFPRYKGIALNLQNTQATDFVWRNMNEIGGQVDLSGAHFVSLVDDPESWDKVKDLSLDGLSYDHIINPGDIGTRLQWLAKGDRMNGEFSPQPYTQLAKVLRGMGHDRDARQVLFEKEKRLAQAERQRSQERAKELQAAESAPDFHSLPQHVQQNQSRAQASLREERFFSAIWNALLRSLVGYGYKPRLILYWTGGIILAMATLSLLTYNLGGMVPNSPVVLLSDEWGNAVEDFNPAEVWVATKAGQHYETFSAVAYAADVFIPLVPLGQEVAWAPTTQTTLGTIVWMLNWLVKLSGWFITALGAAAIAGVIRRD